MSTIGAEVAEVHSLSGETMRVREGHERSSNSSENSRSIKKVDSTPYTSRPGGSSALQSAWIQRLLAVRMDVSEDEPQMLVDYRYNYTDNPRESSEAELSETLLRSFTGANTEEKTAVIPDVKGDAVVQPEDSKVVKSLWLSRFSSSKHAESRESRETKGSSVDANKGKCKQRWGKQHEGLGPEETFDNPKVLPPLNIKATDSGQQIPLLTPIYAPLNKIVESLAPVLVDPKQPSCSSYTCSLPSTFLRDISCSERTRSVGNADLQRCSSSSDTKSLFGDHSDDAVDSCRKERGSSIPCERDTLTEKNPSSSHCSEQDHDVRSESAVVKSSQQRPAVVKGSQQWLQRWSTQRTSRSQSNLHTLQHRKQGKSKCSSPSSSTGTTKLASPSNKFKDANSSFKSGTDFYTAPSSTHLKHNHGLHQQQQQQQQRQKIYPTAAAMAMLAQHVRSRNME